MSLHGDVNAERPSVPPEVQLKVAQCLLNEDIVPTPKQQSTFARLLTVSRTFLHVGLGQLYGHSSFEAYEESLTRLQQIRYADCPFTGQFVAATDPCGTTGLLRGSSLT
jgi:hypothetical protein